MSDPRLDTLAGSRFPAWLAAALFLPVLLPETAREVLEYRRAALLDGELWRLIAAHVVHWNPGHALFDGIAVLALAWAVPPRYAKHLPWLLAGFSLGISLILFVTVPDMTAYRGASGLALALAGLLAVRLWRQPPLRAWIALALFALLAKIIADALGLAPRLGTLPETIQVAWQAHLAGLAMGIGWAAMESARSSSAP